MRYENPVNGYEETASVPFLWCLLFGVFYFMVKGIWKHVFISFLLACCTLGLSWLVYPFSARGIVINYYGRKGWTRIS